MLKRRPEQFGGGRHRPYTPAGVHRLLCSVAGCSRRAHAQWSACADGNVHRPLCPEHDVELNALALEWWGDPDRTTKIAAYRAQMEAEIGDLLDLPST